MQKIKEALQRLRETKGLYHQVVFGEGYFRVVVSGMSDAVMEHEGSYTVDSIAAAIDKYRESLKPKPRPIPEIVRDVKDSFAKRQLFMTNELGKLLDELQNSPAATSPF